MANKKFSEFTLKTDSANVDFVVGYDGTDNVRIAPDNLGGGGASSLNGLSDALIDGNSVYLAEVPSGLSGNPTDNTVLGIDAGQGLTTGFGNTFIGFEAAKLIADSDNMVIIGRQAGNASSSNGDRTVAIGFDAHGSSISTDNVAIGSAASKYSGANFCVALGSSSALFNGAAKSISIGYQTNYSAQSGGAGIVSIGYQAGYSQTSGTDNTNVGELAGYSNTTGQGRTMIGRQSGAYNTGNFNPGVGRSACSQGTGFRHTSVCYTALGGNNTSSNNNTAIGSNCMMSNGAKSSNTAVGSEAGRLITTGSNNVVLGYQSGDSLTTGSNNIVIGYQAAASAVDVSNEITLGDANIATLRCQVQTISALSDSRDKTNVQPSTYGLDLISQLQPVTFDWNMRDGAKVGQKDLGFIAQELQEVDDENLQLVYDNNPDRLEASYGRLIPVLVQAIKELKAEVELLKA